VHFCSVLLYRRRLCRRDLRFGRSGYRLRLRARILPAGVLRAVLPGVSRLPAVLS
jgi:hypothetical protein